MLTVWGPFLELVTESRWKYKEELFSSVGPTLLSMCLSILAAALGFWHISLPLTRIYLACLSGLYPGTKLKPEQESVSLAGTLILLLARDKSQHCLVFESLYLPAWPASSSSSSQLHDFSEPLLGVSILTLPLLSHFTCQFRLQLVSLDTEGCLWWEFNSNAPNICASPSWTPLQRTLSRQTRFGYLRS